MASAGFRAPGIAGSLGMTASSQNQPGGSSVGRSIDSVAAMPEDFRRGGSPSNGAPHRHGSVALRRRAANPFRGSASLRRSGPGPDLLGPNAALRLRMPGNGNADAGMSCAHLPVEIGGGAVPITAVLRSDGEGSGSPFQPGASRDSAGFRLGTVGPLASGYAH